MIFESFMSMQLWLSVSTHLLSMLGRQSPNDVLSAEGLEILKSRSELEGHILAREWLIHFLLPVLFLTVSR